MLLPKSSIIIQGKFNKSWLLLFHHDSSQGDYFHDYSEIEYLNTKNKFSILGFINKNFQINGAYEFLLEYPNLNGYNLWKQTKFPLEVKEGGDSNGYIKDSCECEWKNDPFSGLMLSGNNNSFIDGCNGGFWYFAIGAKAADSQASPNTFPGPYDKVTGEFFSVSEVNLWLHVPKKVIIDIYDITINIIVKKYITSINIFIFIIK